MLGDGISQSKNIPSYDKRRQVLGKVYPLVSPFTVILDASEACNFKCSYCFRSGDKPEAWGDYAKKKNNMNWETFIKAVEQVMEFPEQVKMISLSAHGEPLCNRRLPDMVRHIKAQGFGGRVSIHTNASMLDEQYALDLADSGIDKIVVSLQGLDSATYKEVCGFELDFERFYNNIKLLYEHKKSNTVLNIKIMDVAVGERQEKFYELFSQIADTVFVEKTVPIWKELGDKTHPDTMRNKYGGEFPYQECCPLIFNTLLVTPDGDVYPCTQIISKECLGNINTRTLLEMWNSLERKELLRRQLTLDAPETCNGCYIRQNSIFAEEDMIDSYREEILERLNGRGSF